MCGLISGLQRDASLCAFGHFFLPVLMVCLACFSSVASRRRAAV
jgi:hypothetical protein